jgi:large conductance mechanosensitive channel
MRGNVIDLALAAAIGGAFSAIIGSLVAEIITPLILNPALKASGVENIAKLAWNGVLYGKFIATVINFIAVAFCIFLLVKGMNALQKKKEEAPASAPKAAIDQVLLSKIRDY